MRSIVQGGDYLLEGWKVDDYYPFACAVSSRIRRTNEYDSTVTPDSGEMRSRMPSGLSDITIEFTGVTVLEDEVDAEWKGWEFFTRQMRDQGILLRLTKTDSAGNLKTAGGFFYPQEIESFGEVGSPGEDRILFIGGGGVFDTDGGIDPPEIEGLVKRVVFLNREGNRVWHDDLIGVTKEQILEISREGDDKYDPIDEGVPTERQALLDNTDGSLTFSSAVPEEVFVFALVSII